MSRLSAPDPRWLVGRTIVAYTNGTNAEAARSQGGASHDPMIILDNGARLIFLAEELEGGDGYGIAPIYIPRRRRPRRRPG